MKDFETLAKACLETHKELQEHAVRLVDQSLTIRNWLFGWYIVEYEQQGEDRAEYGTKLVNQLSQFLSKQKIKGCSPTSLKLCRQFYKGYPQLFLLIQDQWNQIIKAIPQIGQSLPGQFKNEILQID